VMWPFLRGGNRATVGADHDLAVYRDQLAELEQEVGRGLISEASAAEARAEIGRRILQLKEAEADGGGQAGQGRRLARAVAFTAVLAVPVMSWSLYSVLGSPGMGSEPLAARLSRDPALASIEELI